MAKADKEGLGAIRTKVGLIIDAAWKSREEAEARGGEWHLDSKGTTEGATLLEKAMCTKNSDGTRLTKEEVYSECFLPLYPAPPFLKLLTKAHTLTSIVGQDSTTFVITNTLKLLLTSPRVLETLLFELTTYYQQKPLSHIPPWTDIVDLDSKLPYLSAVLCESLRLHPAFPMSNVGIVPSSGITLTHCKRLYTIPGGYKISANPIVIGRNKRIFGEDAHCFRPERWLEGSEAETKRMKGVEFEWGAGSGGCLGKALGQMIVAKAIVMLLRNFEVGLAGGHERREAWRLVAMGMHHATELWVKVEPREDEMDGGEEEGEMNKASERM